MQIGICASAVNQAAALANAPIDYIEEHVQNFLAPEGDDAAFADRLRRAAQSARSVVAACCFLPASLKCVGPAVDMPHLLRWSDAAFGRARRAGIDTIVFGSGGARTAPEGFSATTAFEQYVAALIAMAPIAHRHGVTLVVEPLNRGECNVVNSVDEGGEAVRRCGHPSVRLLADLYHMMKEGEGPDAIRRNGDLIRHTHVAERDRRTPPGIVGDDFRPYLRALREVGYDHRMSIECTFGDMAAELAPAVAALRRQLAEVGR